MLSTCLIAHAADAGAMPQTAGYLVIGKGLVTRASAAYGGVRQVLSFCDKYYKDTINQVGEDIMSEKRDTVRVRADKVIDGVVYRKCPNCGELKPLDEFGLRRMKDQPEEGSNLITNQSWCRVCRR